ncbi:MAG: hypothetical protein M3502_03840 [Actinomycetota bacterium]|nr:hypothetical protein [Actinomycetota bacterium]
MDVVERLAQEVVALETDEERVEQPLDRAYGIDRAARFSHALKRAGV